MSHDLTPPYCFWVRQLELGTRQKTVDRFFVLLGCGPVPLLDGGAFRHFVLWSSVLKGPESLQDKVTDALEDAQKPE